jgi:RNA polymerase sigma factor (sigma-70 family)
MTVRDYNKSVEDYSDGLFRFILKNLRDEERAHDIVQDSYEKLWEKVETVDSLKVKSYLFSTAYHTMIDIIRKESRQSLIEDISQFNMSNENQYNDLSEVLNEALNRLPEDQKSVILLRDFEGYSYEEIAKITGLNESQVKVYIYRGRLFLKKYLVSIEKVL